MPSKMDLSVVAAYGDEIWNSKTDADTLSDHDDVPEEQPPIPKNTKKRNGQDRVVSAQIYLAIVAAVLFFAVKFLFPGLFQTLYAQYVEFVSETPVWNLDGIIDAFSPDETTAKITDYTLK